MGYYLDMWVLPHRTRYLDHFETKDQYILLLSPRDHLKTSTVTGWILQKLCYNPTQRVLCVSNTMELARQNLSVIRNHLEGNPRILRDFGNMRSEPWGSEKIQLLRPLSPGKEPTCLARSLGASVIGMHFDIIWCDDIVKLENQWTEEQREKVWNWFTGTLLRCLDRHGKLIVTGTRKHLDDLYHQLLTSKGWTSYVYKAIIDESREAVLAPWLYPFQRLTAERERMGPLMFSQEMQNEPVAMEGLELKKEWVKFYDPTNPPVFQWYYMGVDPAMGKSTGSSYTAVCLIGVTTRYDFYVLDLIRARWTVEWKDQVKQLYESYINRGWPPLTVGIESIMTFRMLPEELMQTTAMPIRMVDYREKGDTQIKDEWHRILALGDFFRHGRIYLPDPNQYPMTATFLHEEYLMFPKGEYTDMLNALNIAINLVTATPSKEAAFRIG